MAGPLPTTPSQLQVDINGVPWSNTTGQITGVEVQYLMDGIVNLFATYTGSVGSGSANELAGYSASGNSVGPVAVGSGLTVTPGNPPTLSATGSGSGTVNSGAAGDLAYYATTGTAVSQLALGAGLSISGGVLNSSATTGAQTFQSYFAAQQGVIPGGVNSITTLGYYNAGDNGGGTYALGASLKPSNPGFTTGVPVLCYATYYGVPNSNTLGPLTFPIIPGVLAVIILTNRTAGYGASGVTDSAGNVYTLAAQSAYAGNTATRSTSIWYCANPAYVPIGGSITVTGTDPTNWSIYAYTVPGFAGAVFDQSATYVKDNYSNSTGFSINTGATVASPELVFACIDCGADPYLEAVNGISASLNPGTGWSLLSPSGQIYQNEYLAYVSNSAGPVNFAPTWANIGVPISAAVATFKTFFATTLTPQYWNLLPTYPPHTAQCGVSPALADNSYPLRAFNSFLASIAPASRSISGVTFSVASPSVITTPSPHRLHSGAVVSFSVSAGGSLPVDSVTGQPLVAGQFYYVQYGSTGSTTLEISYTSVLNNTGNYETTQAAGASVGISAVGAGTITMTIYAEQWSEYVFDPGVYNGIVDNQQTSFGMGTGIQKLRIHGYGATLNYYGFFSAHPQQDVNAGLTSNEAFRAYFQTTNPGSVGNNVNSITLVTASQAANFYPNGWVLLMCLEQQGSYSGPPNQAYFEFQRVLSVNASTGVITFYENLQNNYRSTFPPYQDQLSSTIAKVGPAIVMQLSDVFDQEVVVEGMRFLIPTAVQEEFVGIKSFEMVDCEVYGPVNIGDSGPLPSFMRRFTARRCNWYGCQPEIDKLIDTLEFIECTFEENAAIFFNSGSCNRVLFLRCRLRSIIGTSKFMVIRECDLYQLDVGTVYGSTQRLVIENSSIATIQSMQAAYQWVFVKDITFTNGTIKVANGNSTTGFYQWNGGGVGYCPIPWAKPGARIALSCAGNPYNPNASGINIGATMSLVGAPFSVVDVYMDGSNNFCVDTTLGQIPTLSFTFTAGVSNGSGGAGTQMAVTAMGQAGAYILNDMVITGGGLPAGTTAVTGAPAVPNGGGNLATYTLNNSAYVAPGTMLTASLPLIFLPLIARVTVINSSGNYWLSDQAGAPPDIPMWSYFNRQFFGFPELYYQPYQMLLCGNVKSITVNVTKPYTGAEASYTAAITLFGFQSYNGGANLYPIWQTLTIDLKTTGTRVITATGFVGSVGADSIAGVPFWVTGNVICYVGPNSSGGDTLNEMPLWSIVGISDQGGAYGTLSATSNESYPTNWDVIGDSNLGLTTQ